MIFEMTVQIRVEDFQKGKWWYEPLINRKPDFVHHVGIAEWEIIPGGYNLLKELQKKEWFVPIRCKKH